MARLFADGFELGNLDLWDRIFSAAVSSSSPSASTGLYSFKGNNGAVKYVNAGKTLYVAFRVKLNYAGEYSVVLTNLRTSASSSFFQNIYTDGDAGAVGGLQLWFADDHLEFGYYPKSGAGFTQIGSDRFYGTQTDFHVQIRFTQDVSGNMLLQAKLDGFTCLNETILASQILQNANFYGWGISSTNCGIDDVVVDDANWPGASRIYLIVPESIGDLDTWYQGSIYSVPSGTKPNAVALVSTANPPIEAHYIYNNVVLDQQLFVCSNLPSTASEVKSVSLSIVALTPGSPAPTNLQIIKKIAGTASYSATKSILYNWGRINEFLENDPITASAWTVARVNDLQLGVRLVSS